MSMKLDDLKTGGTIDGQDLWEACVEHCYIKAIRVPKEYPEECTLVELLESILIFEVDKNDKN